MSIGYSGILCTWFREVHDSHSGLPQVTHENRVVTVMNEIAVVHPIIKQCRFMDVIIIV